MNYFVYLLIFFLSTQSISMDRPFDISQRAIRNYQPFGIYVEPSKATGMINLLKRESILNDLTAQDKKQLEESATKLNKPFLRELAQTVTIQSECGRNFAIPRTVAQETQLLNIQLARNEPIRVNINAQLLDLYFQASWFKYYTDTLFWMKNYRILNPENENDLLQVANRLGADFVKKNINDTNQKTGKF